MADTAQIALAVGIGAVLGGGAVLLATRQPNPTGAPPVDRVTFAYVRQARDGKRTAYVEFVDVTGAERSLQGDEYAPWMQSILWQARIGNVPVIREKW